MSALHVVRCGYAQPCSVVSRSTLQRFLLAVCVPWTSHTLVCRSALCRLSVAYLPSFVLSFLPKFSRQRRVFPDEPYRFVFSPACLLSCFVFIANHSGLQFSGRLPVDVLMTVCTGVNFFKDLTWPSRYIVRESFSRDSRSAESRVSFFA